MAAKQSFVAYASTPKIIGDTIKPAVEKANKQNTDIKYITWEANDISGRPLIQPIYDNVGSSPFVVADISVLNFNVVFEIGYSIGQQKRVLLIKNTSINIDQDLVQKIGIFDTLGHHGYQNSDDLSKFLSQKRDVKPLTINKTIEAKAKTWVLQTPSRTEAMTRIIAQVKKKMFAYRSFDPAEQARMVATDTIDQIGVSTGVIIPLLPEHITDSKIHNVRAAFTAGLACGMNKVILILQDKEGASAPLDIRDLVKKYSSPSEIDEQIVNFKEDVEKSFYGLDPVSRDGSNLEKLELGAPTAENEFQTLQSYFVRTDEFGRTLRGEVNLVLGRKGSGKTALFSQVRNELRKNKANVVVDLKPEGYQLLKLKDIVLKHLQEGSQAHLITAFWDYILLLEVAYKLLEKDQQFHMRDRRLYEPYRKLSEVYKLNGYVSDGDFSERLVFISNHVGDSYVSLHPEASNVRLSGDDITQILYKHDIRLLRQAISEYLRQKEQVWILFDNIDKGWSTRGVSEQDIIIVSSLIEAAWKVQRDMSRDGHNFHSVIFLRNDVYQVLVKNVPDRGKDIKVNIDWSDADKLKELLRKRIVFNDKPETAIFSSLWNEIFIPEFDGVNSADYLIERCLMRPRYLLLLISHCRGVAVNNGHAKITHDDVKKGAYNYSNDLIVETDNELRDILREAEGLIYQFIGEESDMFDTDLERHYKNANIPSERYRHMTEFLLWYGVIGLVRQNGNASFIHTVGYDIQKLITIRQKEGGDCPIYRINSAYWPGLSIMGPEEGGDWTAQAS